MADCVFSKSLLVQVKNQERQDRATHLQVTIDVRTTAPPLQKKYLHIQLTDHNDNFFLYTLRIDEEDFQSLKSSQGILVDFPSFPQKLTELFTLCLNEENKEIPKFILQLLINDGFSTLNIVETNPFKHLIHLSLKVIPGNDAAIKSFLSDRLNELKAKNVKLVDELDSTESSLRSTLKATEETLTARNTELARLNIQWESKLSEIQAKNAQILNQEKEEFLKNQNTVQQRYQAEKRDLEQAHMKIVKQLEARVYELDTQNKELTETKFVNDATIRDLNSKLSLAEDEGKRMRQDVQQLRRDNSDMDAELHKQEKVVSQLQTRIAVLEQQLNDKDGTVDNLEKLQMSEQSQKKHLEEQLATVKSHSTQLETNIKTLSDEVLKANEIIRKLQQESKSVQAKLKLRSQIALKQEEVLKDKDKQMEGMEIKLKQLSAETETKTQSFTQMKCELEKTKDELSECHKKIASNENVISWLNKQLDQLQLGRARVATSMGTSGSPPVHTVSLVTSKNTTTSTRNQTAESTAPPMSLADTPNHTSRIPQPKHKSTPFSPVTSQEDKENEPIIDAKYLPQTQGAVLHAPLRTRNWSPEQVNPVFPPVKTRISKDIVNPHNALLTAYFPKQK